MTSKLATLTAVAALSLAPAAAFAQSAAPSASTPPTATQTMPEPGSPMAPADKMPGTSVQTPMKNSSASATPTAVPATPKFVSAQSSGQWLGSELIGTEVVTSTDENLGEISDLVMERDGSVIAAVIDVGGFLGIGAKPVAVSFESLTPTPTDDGQKIVVAMTKEELNAAPEFKTLEQQRDETAKTTTN
ncbi:PRC-barrel domain-containing protein [Ancylobacter pratisalsi]|uniref:PRC-barrel domain containing protein n=1 Tax=Ancylobacter pratisalsi TaxID=1745854 RepID=A0A6P1YRV6_9HYPH|nr:PRC-barrel domain-containing protein [Ancylobacter pratisalsi]QIB34444.1 PRC-barrel domain containing protein [Ancylobacter pratisalsi]